MFDYLTHIQGNAKAQRLNIFCTFYYVINTPNSPILWFLAPIDLVVPKWQLLDPAGARITLEISLGQGNVFSLTLVRQ